MHVQRRPEPRPERAEYVAAHGHRAGYKHDKPGQKQKRLLEAAEKQSGQNVGYYAEKYRGEALLQVGAPLHVSEEAVAKISDAVKDVLVFRILLDAFLLYVFLFPHAVINSARLYL